MLSYQHGYHAGNFADVIKHMALTYLLNYLTQKEKPLFYLETHAGKGLYNLKSPQAEKTGEAKQGIELLWPAPENSPEALKNYLKLIQDLNPNQELKNYPGSPYLAMHYLRNQDRIYLCELHPREFELLNNLPRFNKKVHKSEQDGVAAMNALIPPPEKRGLIFIDPSYEIKEEYRDIPKAIKQAFKRFSTGVFCLWYPIVNQRLTDKLTRGMSEIPTQSAVSIEFYLQAAPKEGMYGTGLWVINPPYTYVKEIEMVLDRLKSYFNPGFSSYNIKYHNKN